MALSAGQLSLANQAIAKVQAAADEARRAISGESNLVTWLSGSSAAHDARVNALGQLDRALAQMRSELPGLADSAALDRFLKYAGDLADTKGLIADAQRMSAAGINAEVVKPTVAAIGDGLSFGLGGIGLVLLAVAGLWVWRSLK
jgi:hypothetical protein